MISNLKWQTAGLALPAVLAAVVTGCGASGKATPVRHDQSLARLERGQYLVEHVMHCFMCHSELDWKNPGGQPVRGKKGAGARFEDVPFPLMAPNITPDRETGAGSWSDEQLVRAIREGIGHDGRRLFPIMPYMFFREMADEDLASVIAYLRSIEPVKKKVEHIPLPEPVRQSLPPHQPVTAPVMGPDYSNPVERGRYLVRMANCEGCHTPLDAQGQPRADLPLAGGFVLNGSWGKVAAANLTPDPSGIPYYSEELFVQVLRTGHVQARKLNSVMPWGYFRGMTDQDLKAIYAYLKTVKPVFHRVDNTEEEAPCQRCGFRHGLGAHNY